MKLYESKKDHMFYVNGTYILLNEDYSDGCNYNVSRNCLIDIHLLYFPVNSYNFSKSGDYILIDFSFKVDCECHKNTPHHHMTKVRN